MAPPSAFKSDAAIASKDPVSRAETIPTASSGAVGYAAVDPRPASGASDIVQKPFCVSPGRSDGSCVSFELPKVRVVRVPRVTGGQQGNSAKSGLAAAPRFARINAAISAESKLASPIGERADMHVTITVGRASHAVFGKKTASCTWP